ncbi:MAG: hypothetical protein B7Y83_09130 [Flavobacteriales bacterium 32-34-25]|nr:MAG: hypothetical protein B7Y83_09130 [Flavobacteriales bacterium 32-34-25]
MLNKYIFLIACFLGSIAAVAQPVVVPPPTPPPPGLPIDGGVLVLLVLGLLFGFYKIYVFTEKKKRSV